MSERRDFIKKVALGTIGISSVLGCQEILKNESSKKVVSKDVKQKKPLIISTWKHGLSANKEAWHQLKNGKSAIDAIEEGVKISEANPKVKTVGYGGYPDRDGKVTLDACIMDHNSNCGSVAFLQGIMHPISVAKKVMQKTPHIMLVGEGALQFALSEGFVKENLLTAEAEKAWKKWIKESKYRPVVNIENHDTISMLVMDENGNLSGGCTTSGVAWKIHGRVGDSPIIGAGLFLDNEVGAAAATGLGEAVMRTAGSAMVVELMRHGRSPKEACKEIVERIYKKYENKEDLKYLQVGFIAVNKDGEHGGYSLRSGFNYAIFDEEKGNRMEDAQFKMSWEN